MAKKVTKKIKLVLPAGKATPAPPVGTALGPAGINIGEFVTKFNEQTRDRMGDTIPVELSVYEDRTFDFILKISPLIFSFVDKDVDILLTACITVVWSRPPTTLPTS